MNQYAGFVKRRRRLQRILERLTIFSKGMKGGFHADEIQHVAIHIKNEGLNLTIAEGSSGRGRL